MATVKFNLEADEADAVRAFLRVVDAQNKAEGQFRRTTQAGKEQFDLYKQATSDLASMATQFLSIGTAIEGARRSLEYFNREREAGQKRLQEAEFSGSRLMQLARSPQEARSMLSAAEQTSRETGMPLAEAQRMQFELESSGLGRERGMFSGLYGIIDRPAEISRAIVTARNAFGRGARSPRQTLNEAALAAGPETIDLDQVLLNTAGIAPGIAQLGGTQEEAFASLAMLSGARKDPEQAATEIRSLMTQMMRKNLGGGGLFNAMEAMAARTAGMSDKRKIAYFQDQEAFRGFQTLAPRLGELRERAGAMARLGIEGPDDEVARMIGMREQIPELSAPRRSRIAEQLLEGRRMDRYGVSATESDLAVKAIELESLGRGENSFYRGIRSAVAGGARAVGASPETILNAGARALYNDNPGETVAVLKQILSELKGGPAKSRNQQQVE